MPKPCSELKSAADDIKLEATVDRYPRVPKPCNELVSCGVEITLSVPEDK